MQPGEFNKGSGALRRDKNAPDAYYNCFDIIEREEWRAKQTKPYGERRAALDRLLGDKPLKSFKLVENEKLPQNPSAADIVKLRDDFIAKGHEGLMLKNDDSPYIFKRSRNLLKFKLFLDADVPIVGFVEGEKGTKTEGMLGAVVVEFNGARSNVGSGWSDEQRREIYENQPLYLNKIIEIQYQGLQPSGAFRFATFQKFRPDKDSD